MKRTIGAVVAVSVLLVTSGCGGSGSRPSEDELSKALQKDSTGKLLGGEGTKINKKAADCIAKVLVESKISDRALQAIVDGRKSFNPSKADQGAAIGVASKIVTCLPAGLGN